MHDPMGSGSQLRAVPVGRRSGANGRRDHVTDTTTAAADGLLRVRWEERVTRWVGEGELCVEVPLIGRAASPAFGYLVGRQLQERWTGESLIGVRVRSVAGYCDETRRERTLRLLILLDRSALPSRRIDGVHMARDVADVVRQVSSGVPDAGALRP